MTTDAPRAVPSSSPASSALPPEVGRQPVSPNASPEITKSLGQRGGVVVLWPRLQGKAKSSERASKVQAHLRDLTQRAALSKPVDARPEPERACPKPNGCDATAVGFVLIDEGAACAAVVTVSAPGASPQRLVAWAGQMHFKQPTVPFREPPESQIVVDDFVPCDQLDAALRAGDADVQAAIKAAL